MNRVFIFIGASGSGKTTLEHRLKELRPNDFHNVISATTRAIKGHETHGKDYWFLSESEFLDMEFAESESFAGAKYGTPVHELNTEKDLLITMEPIGAKKLIDYIKNNLPEKNVFIIFFNIPEDIRINNMYKRGESESQIKTRIAKDDIDDRFAATGLKPDLVIEKLYPGLAEDVLKFIYSDKKEFINSFIVS